MADLEGSKTLENLRRAFALECQANRRYLHFAKRAETEGLPDVAGLFRDTAEGEAAHAHHDLDLLQASGDPVTHLPMGSTKQNLQAAVASESQEYQDIYPEMAQIARDEGFAQIAEWFEDLAISEREHAGRFQQMLDSMG